MKSFRDRHVDAEAGDERDEVTGSRSREVRARRPRAVLWLAAVTAAALLGALPAVAAGFPLQYPPTPDGGGLNGVQCFGGIASCLAVGGSSQGVLVDRLHGSSWSQVRAPNPHVPGTATFDSISCKGARSCVAVGGNGCGGPLAEVWNGRVWSLADKGLPACRPYLTSVSCASARDCLAVGGVNLGGANVSGGVVERWDGRSWSPINYKTSYPVWLAGVSCPVHDGCAVVGADSSGESVVGWWNGSSIAFLGLRDGTVSGNPDQQQQGAMNGVSCTSVHFCEAVGSVTPDYFDSPWSEAITWNGSSWGRETAPPGVANPLVAVSCVSAGDCGAIDQSGDPPYFERLRAGRWESEGRDPGFGFTNLVDGVWCQSLTSCVTVGVHQLGQDNNFQDLGPMAAAGDL